MFLEKIILKYPCYIRDCYLLYTQNLKAKRTFLLKILSNI